MTEPNVIVSLPERDVASKTVLSSENCLQTFYVLSMVWNSLAGSRFALSCLYNQIVNSVMQNFKKVIQTGSICYLSVSILLKHYYCFFHYLFWIFSLYIWSVCTLEINVSKYDRRHLVCQIWQPFKDQLSSIKYFRYFKFKTRNVLESWIRLLFRTIMFTICQCICNPNSTQSCERIVQIAVCPSWSVKSKKAIVSV